MKNNDLFPYRKYSRIPAPQRRYRFRFNHDFWQWIFILVFLVWMIIWEVLRY
jgi:maltodextrin utilization protein YvdJ